MKILALDIGGTTIKSAIIDDSNQISDSRVTPSASNVSDRVQIAVALARDYTDYDVVSVASCGQIDDKTRRILFQYHQKHTPDDPGFPFGETFKNALSCPVFVLNDSNAAALGEAYLGAGQAYSDFLCLTYGTGVGGAIIQNRKLFQGNRGIAGEVGHMVTHKGGRLCGCGRRGCYEQYASTTALLRKAKESRPELENAKQLLEAMSSDAALRRILGAWEQEIVEGLFTLTHIFNPACIILGGGIMEQKCVLEGVRRRFYRGVIPTFAGVELLPATLGNQAGIFGAAIYARQQMTNEIS